MKGSLEGGGFGGKADELHCCRRKERREGRERYGQGRRGQVKEEKKELTEEECREGRRITLAKPLSDFPKLKGRVTGYRKRGRQRQGKPDMKNMPQFQPPSPLAHPSPLHPPLPLNSRNCFPSRDS